MSESTYTDSLSIKSNWDSIEDYYNDILKGGFRGVAYVKPYFPQSKDDLKELLEKELQGKEVISYGGAEGFITELGLFHEYMMLLVVEDLLFFEDVRKYNLEELDYIKELGVVTRRLQKDKLEEYLNIDNVEPNSSGEITGLYLVPNVESMITLMRELENSTVVAWVNGYPTSYDMKRIWDVFKGDTVVIRIESEIFLGDATALPGIERLKLVDKGTKVHIGDLYNTSLEIKDEKVNLSLEQGDPLTGGEDEEYDVVDRPKHYNLGSIEVIDLIDVITANFVGPHAYHIGNALKYTFRAPFKGAKVEDLKKARFYVNHSKELWDPGEYKTNLFSRFLGTDYPIGNTTPYSYKEVKALVEEVVIGYEPQEIIDVTFILIKILELADVNNRQKNYELLDEMYTELIEKIG